MKISENNPNHLFQRILWAKERLAPVEPQYVIVYERPGGEGEISVQHPSPEFLAMAMHGNLLPPVDVYLQIRCQWVHHDGRTLITDLLTHPGPGWNEGKVLNGHLLHTVRPVSSMTEEEAMEYLVQKDLPRAVWADHERVNRPRFYICRRDQLPTSRAFRKAWRLSDEALLEKVA